MEQEIMLDDKNILAMKLLHYFITERNYNPIILQGVENEIWLENLKEDCKVVRIVSGYIHNNEQFDFDEYKTRKILGKIKKKTLSFNMNVLSIFLDLGDNVNLKDKTDNPNLLFVNANTENDIKNSDTLSKVFPDLTKKIDYEERGEALFMKITKDINKHNREDAIKVEKIFRRKFPMVTYIILAINILFFLIPIILGAEDYVINLLCTHGPSIRSGQYYRLFTGMIVHAGITHLAVNSWSLYILGSQMESYLGKVKFLIVYILSGFTGALLSIAFSGNVASVGASGAIFGLLGSMLYFGYHYRVFLGNVIKTNILPIIIANLMIGFIVPGIDNAAHIGGLIGGTLITMALGVENKSTRLEKFNGWVITSIFIAFLLYMGLIYTA